MQKIFDRDILKELFVNEFISNDYESWVQIYEKLTTTTNFDNTPVNMDDVENLKRKTLSNKQLFLLKLLILNGTMVEDMMQIILV